MILSFGCEMSMLHMTPQWSCDSTHLDSNGLLRNRNPQQMERVPSATGQLTWKLSLLSSCDCGCSVLCLVLGLRARVTRISYSSQVATGMSC